MAGAGAPPGGPAARLLAWLQPLDRALRAVLGAVLLALIAFFFFAVLYQILSRNLAALPNVFWTEELSRFAFQWLVVLGAALGVANDDHFVLEVASPDRAAGRALLVLRDAALLAIAVVFVVYGWPFAESGLRRRATATGLPMIWIYAGFAVCGALMIVFLLERLLASAVLGVVAARARPAHRSPDAPDAGDTGGAA